MSSSTTLTVDSGTTFDISGATITEAVKALSGSGTVKLGGGTISLGANGHTFSGVIADGGLSGGTGGAVIVNGTETLSGLNT